MCALLSPCCSSSSGKGVSGTNAAYADDASPAGTSEAGAVLPPSDPCPGNQSSMSPVPPSPAPPSLPVAGVGTSTDSQAGGRSEEHTSELQSLMHISYAVFCLKKNNKHITPTTQ